MVRLEASTNTVIFSVLLMLFFYLFIDVQPPIELYESFYCEQVHVRCLTVNTMQRIYLIILFGVRSVQYQMKKYHSELINRENSSLWDIPFWQNWSEIFKRIRTNFGNFIENQLNLLNRFFHKNKINSNLLSYQRWLCLSNICFSWFNCRYFLWQLLEKR